MLCGADPDTDMEGKHNQENGLFHFTHLGVLRQEKGRGLHLCARRGRKGRDRGKNHPPLKICIQKGFKESLIIHTPLKSFIHNLKII